MSLASRASEIREKDLMKITEEHGLVIKYGSYDNEGYLFSDGSILKLEGTNQEFSTVQEPKESFRINITEDDFGESVISIQDHKINGELPNKMISKLDLSYYDHKFGEVEAPEGVTPIEIRTVNIYQDGTTIERKKDTQLNKSKKTYTKEMTDDFLKEMGLSGEELNLAIKQKIEDKNKFSLGKFLDEKINALNPFSNKKKNEKRSKNKIS